MKTKENTTKNSAMPNAHLHELLVDGLRDLLYAEKELLKGLKKMAQSAQNDKLKEAFEKHHEETKSQIDTLKEVFNVLGLHARGKKCPAMDGLLKEAEEIASDFEDSPALDAALIAAAQKIEHYEIASYGCLVTYAQLMEHKEVAGHLQGILDQEKQTDEALSDLASISINEQQGQ